MHSAMHKHTGMVPVSMTHDRERCVSPHHHTELQANTHERSQTIARTTVHMHHPRAEFALVQHTKSEL